ncbi:MAG TPA: pyruvate kinase [Acidimicrobiia bacterium]|nr:pyruvate kinase [Acidimicrobiia bacterium]
MRRTKIVATVGPATSDPTTTRALLEAGADVLRLNAAHGDAHVHSDSARRIRAAADALGRSAALLVDLPGPKLRTGDVAGDSVSLSAGERFVLGALVEPGDEHRVATTVPDLAHWVTPGDEITLADGAIVLVVDDVRDGAVHTTIARGGLLRSRKGMHIPRAEQHIEPFTDADRDALELALALRAEFVGISFVRHARDVEQIRSSLPRRGYRPQLVTKIETAIALDELDGIIAVADAVMVARGDLGIEVPEARVPLIQKDIIRRCNAAGKPVITATQMLESMTRAPMPTRAEVNDVANAVIDGTDALMLSEETAVGAHPIEAVRTMANVAIEAERWPRDRVVPAPSDDDRVAWAVAHAAVEAAEDLAVTAILCPTHSGVTARRVASFRPRMPVIGAAERPEILGQLRLVWGVQPVAVAAVPDGADRLDLALRAARTAGLLAAGDLVAVVMASPAPRAGATDTVRIVRA